MSLWTFLKEQWGKSQRDARAAVHLARTLDRAVAIGEYQRGFESWPSGKPKTYCNIMALDVLDRRAPKMYLGTFVGAFDYDIRPALKDGKYENLLNTPLSLSYKLLKDAPEVSLVMPRYAQGAANRGVPVLVVSARYDHMAIVYPDTEEYDRNRGPKIAQAGWYNGVFYMGSKEAFGACWTDQEIIYVILEEFGD